MEQCPACFCQQWELFTTAVDRVLPRPEENWEIQRCQDCGFGLTTPVLSEEKIKQYYPSTYHGDTVRTIEAFPFRRTAEKPFLEGGEGKG